MPDTQTVKIVMIEDDEGHARLIEKNIRRAGISNDLKHFLDGTSGLKYLFEEIHEVLVGRFDHVFGSAGLHRIDRDSSLVGSRHIDDRRALLQLAQLGQRFQPVHAGHVVVYRNDVETALTRQIDPFAPRAGADNRVPSTAKLLFDQPAQAGVVVDVKDAARLLHQRVATSGS